MLDDSGVGAEEDIRRVTACPRCWARTTMSADVKGDACEGPLEKNTQDPKSNAGQYSTPRACARRRV